MRAIRGAQARNLPWLESTAGDTRYAVRQFRGTPLALWVPLAAYSVLQKSGADVVPLRVADRLTRPSARHAHRRSARAR